jgi:hypothetical protein
MKRARATEKEEAKSQDEKVLFELLDKVEVSLRSSSNSVTNLTSPVETNTTETKDEMLPAVESPSNVSKIDGSGTVSANVEERLERYFE